MSIVSAKDGMVAIPSKKRGAVNAIQWGQDVVPDYRFPEQLPTVNQFRKIRVPSGNPRPSPNGCDVPVKFKQEGDDYQRPETELFESTKLKPFEANFNVTLRQLIEGRQELQADTFNVEYLKPGRGLDYNAGIKPAPRAINFTNVVEPTGQQFRP